eukprot:3701848-Pleurochrysis_carterae.AAC.2
MGASLAIACTEHRKLIFEFPRIRANQYVANEHARQANECANGGLSNSTAAQSDLKQLPQLPERMLPTSSARLDLGTPWLRCGQHLCFRILRFCECTH